MVTPLFVTPLRSGASLRSAKRLIIAFVIVVFAGATPAYSHHPNGCMASSATQKACVYRSRGPGTYRAGGFGTPSFYRRPPGFAWGIRISHDGGRTWINARSDYEPFVWTASIPSQRGDLVWIFVADFENGFIEAHDDD